MSDTNSTDDMEDSTDTQLEIDDDSALNELAPDQHAVMNAYREGVAFTVSSASSGTGKTTLGVRAVSDSVYRDLDADGEPGGLLFTTFTKRAAREDRERVIAELETYVEEQRAAGTATGDPLCENWESVRTWLHMEADIRTLDSAFVEWYEEIARVTDLPMDVSVGEGLGRAELLDHVGEALERERTTNPTLDEAIAVLERRYGTSENQAGHMPWIEQLATLHQKCREFCKPPSWGAQTLRDNVDVCFPGGRPADATDVATAIRRLSDDDIDPEHIAGAWVSYAQETYDSTRQLAESLATVLLEYSTHYESAVREVGALSHHDVAYLVATYLDEELPEVETPANEQFTAHLREQYDHVIIDEMQDTSYAQLRLLSVLFPPDMDGIEGLGIGDLKQSVYAWRSADPALFAELVGADTDPSGDLLGVDDVNCNDLEDSYRSHPHIIGSVNEMFPPLFGDTSRGAAGRFSVPYQPLRSRRVATESDEPHLHVITLPSGKRKNIERTTGPQRVASRLRGAIDEETLRIDANQALEDVDGSQPDLRPMVPGDVALVFRAKSYMDAYARELADHGFKVAVVSGDNLFETPEVRIVRGLLVAISDFSRPEAIRWLAESAFTTVDDEGVTVLREHRNDLDAALDAVEQQLASASDPATTKKLKSLDEQLRSLTTLRESLRVQRHDRKELLVRQLVDSTALEPLLLGTRDGFARNANVQRFIDIIAEWEADEPLSLQSLLQRIERSANDSGDEFGGVDGPELAVTADEYADDTILLLTVHKAKGLEFKTVVLPDLHRRIMGRSPSNDGFVLDREDGLAVRPWADDADRPTESVTGHSLEYFWHTSDAKFYEDRGHTWLSAKRNPPCASLAGDRIHRHPLSETVGDSIAEEWRVLYVAVTRACDHLILPLQQDPHENPYDSWGATLWAALDLGNARGSFHHAPAVTGDGDAFSIPVSIDELPPEEQTRSRPRTFAGQRLAGTYRKSAGNEIDVTDLPPAAPETEARTAPLKITPSSFYTLIDDPASLFDSMTPTVDVLSSATRLADGSYPADLDANVWGDIVHKAAELAVIEGLAVDALRDASHETRRLATEAVAATLPTSEYSDRARAAAERCLVDAVLPVLATSESYAGDLRGTFRKPEGLTTGTYTDGDATLWIEGEYDLLYADGGWTLVDFKTGTPPASPPWNDHQSFVEYCLQLALYRWLLKHERGLKIDSLRLVYVWPEPMEFEIQFDNDEIEATLGQIAQGRPVTEDN